MYRYKYNVPVRQVSVSNGRTAPVAPQPPSSPHSRPSDNRAQSGNGINKPGLARDINKLFQGTPTSIMEEKSSPRWRSPPVSPVPLQVELGKWRRLSPRIASRLLSSSFRKNTGGSETGPENNFQRSPGDGSLLSPIRAKGDSRRRTLLWMTYINLFLALVLINMGIFGQRYPGHRGTTDIAYTHSEETGGGRVTPEATFLYLANCPTEDVGISNASVLRSAIVVGLVIWLTQLCSAHSIIKQVDRTYAASTLLGAIVCAITCLCAFAVVMVDINYIDGCCSLLEDNCEFSNLCTEFVSECCISDDVKTYCGNPSFRVGAASAIFLLFTFMVVMATTACTMTCQCWIDPEHDPHLRMMVLSRNSRHGRRGRRHQSTSSRSPTLSPPWSPRDNDACIPNEIKMEEGEGVAGFIGGVGGSGRGSGGGCGSIGTSGDGSSGKGGGCKTAMGTREGCALRRAKLVDVATLGSDISKIHLKGEVHHAVTGEKFRLELKPTSLSKQITSRPITRSNRLFKVPDDSSNLRVTGSGEP